MSLATTRPVWVVKIGGAAIDEAAVATAVLTELGRCLDAGIQVVLVHGGGQRLTAVAERLGYQSHFAQGRRITDDGLLATAKMVFAGSVGTDLAALAHAARVPAVAMSGVACGLLQVSSAR